MITIYYESVDSYGKQKRKDFQHLRQAQEYAANWVGRFPEIGRTYAVSGDGIGKITVSGCSIYDLFPQVERWS